MKKIEWTVEKMATLLGKRFIEDMQAHFRRIEDATVEVGEMGGGIKPNYQITFPNGVINTYRGLHHKQFDQAERFDPDHLSQPFSYSDIEKAKQLAIEKNIR